MSLSAWRIVKRNLVAHAFNGEGARLYGGRWNSPGVAVVYSSESQALAVLEILVHFESSDILEHYVMIEVRFDPALVTRLEPSELPAEWLREPPPAGLQLIGDKWIAESVSAVLQVPSAIVPDEHNFLLNPSHPDFSQLTIGRPLPFPFDSRLFANR